MAGCHRDPAERLLWLKLFGYPVATPSPSSHPPPLNSSYIATSPGELLKMSVPGPWPWQIQLESLGLGFVWGLFLRIRQVILKCVQDGEQQPSPDMDS